MSFNNLSTKDEAEPLLEINTTPLIDVMLVLLIMFIITIPAHLHSVNMQSSAAHGVSPEKSMVINIAIDADNSLWWNEHAVADKAALERKLQELQALPTTQHQQPEMRIQAHPLSKYGKVAFVLAVVHRHGFDKINIV